MEDVRTDWYKVIAHHQMYRIEDGGGLTIPYLIGVRAIHQHRELKATRDDAYILLNEVFNQSQPQVLQLTRCSNLKGASVIGLKPKREKPWGKIFTSLKTNSDTILVRQDLIAEWGETAESIIAHLVEESAEAIACGHFSRSRQGTWECFNKEDINFISAALKS